MSCGLNLFVAPLDKRIDSAYLRNEFEKFGDLFSASIAKDENGDSKSYGFVHFCSVSDGERAMNAMNGKMLLGRTVNVTLASKQKDDTSASSNGVKLFVASLDKNIDDAYLKKEFGKFGDLFSACTVKDENGDSKCFGFVHFCSMSDAERAINEMNGKTLLGRPIHVAFANIRNEGNSYNDNTRNIMWQNNWRKYTSNTDLQSQFSEFEGETPSEKCGVKARMRELFETQKFTDVTFYQKNNRKLSISAHRAVLAIGSPLFTKMLFNEYKGETTKMEVEISNLPFDAFTNIVKYLYTDEVFFEHESLVQGILDGAIQFEIQPLVNRCKKYFESLELTEENVCSKLQMSISNKIDALKERCIDFIQKNTLRVINSDDFQRSSSNTIRTICKLQSLNIRSEMELLEAVMKWVHSQPVQNRKLLLEPSLKCFRFLTFTVTELGDTLKRYPEIMTASEGLSIMLYLYNPPEKPDFQKLPSWCNKSTMSRCFFIQYPEGPIAADANKVLMGKILFPLKPDEKQISTEQLTSLLQMKCISGRHSIKSIRLCFEKPRSESSAIHSLSIKVRCIPGGFSTQENVQIVNSESIRVEFRMPILVRQGDRIDIEADAKNITNYRFLQFDDTCHTPVNPHFQSSVASIPKLGKLYFIKEIEYGPQDISRRRELRGRPRRGR